MSLAKEIEMCEQNGQQFSTEFEYQDRQSKSEYVWRKYRSLLSGSKILDVGADECHLKDHLSEGSSYFGIGLGGTPDQQVNVERQAIPFESRSFDVVLCLDVLEHVDNPHQVFDELCRVSKRYVLISLPNPWGAFWSVLLGGDQDGRKLKFYGLPQTAPDDRHKWFFSTSEAEAFTRYRADQCQFRVVQLDRENDNRKLSWRERIRRSVYRRIMSRHLDFDALWAGTMWALLERSENGATE